MQYEEIGQTVTAWQVAAEGEPENPVFACSVGAYVEGEGRIVTMSDGKVIVPLGEWIINRDGFLTRCTNDEFTARYRPVQ